MECPSPCCPRPDRHVSRPCPLLPRLKDPRLNFDELSPEEQFFLLEAPYLPRFTGTFPAMNEWCDPSLNAEGFIFAHLDRDPRIKCVAPQWRQEGSLYVASSGFATGYFSDRTETGNNRRWRLVEYLAPGSYVEKERKEEYGTPLPLPLPLPLDFSESNVDHHSALWAPPTLASGAKRGRYEEPIARRKRKRISRRKGKEAYSCLLQLRSDQLRHLPRLEPAPILVNACDPPPTPALEYRSSSEHN